MRITKTVPMFAFVLSPLFYLPLLLLPEQVVSQADENDQQAVSVVETSAFRIHVHCDNKDVARQVRRVAEKTWGIASKLYASKLPKKKMDVHLYRNVDGYVAADKKLTGGKFERNQAFAHFKTLSAHVALQPPVSDDLLDIVGLPKQSARLLAHEMSHLVRYARMPNSFRDHPRWLIDGAASYIDERAIIATGYMKDPMFDPNFATYVLRSMDLLDQDKLPTAEQLLDNVDLGVGFYQGYAVRWTFFDMLTSKYEARFSAFMKDLPRVGGGRGYASRAKDSLLKFLGTDVETLNKEFVAHLESLRPGWVESTRSLETSGPEWDQIAFPGSTATSWRQAPLPGSFVISLTATIHDAGRKQMNIRVGQPDSFTQFSITAGFGLNVFEYADKQWNTKLAKKIDGLKVGKQIDLSISHDDEKGKMEVTLDGETIFTGDIVKAPKRIMALGAQKGSAVTWSNLKVK